jgi:hypothetical protein
VLIVSLGWGIGWGITNPSIYFDSSDPVRFLFAVIPALIIASGFVISILAAGLPLPRERLVGLFWLWWIGGSIGGVTFWIANTEFYSLLFFPGDIYLLPMLAVFTGTGFLFQSSIPSVSWKSILGGWALALFIGEGFYYSVDFLSDPSYFEYLPGATVLAALAIGAMGGGWMHWQLSRAMPEYRGIAERLRRLPMLQTESVSQSVSVSIWRRWLPFLVICLGWGIGWALYFFSLVKGDFSVAIIVGLFIAGGLVLALATTTPTPNLLYLGLLFLIWWIGHAYALPWFNEAIHSDVSVSAYVVIFGLIFAVYAVSVILLRRLNISLSWGAGLAGWALELVVGFGAAYLLHKDLESYSSAPLMGIAGILHGAIIIGWMLRQAGRISPPSDQKM